MAQAGSSQRAPRAASASTTSTSGTRRRCRRRGSGSRGRSQPARTAPCPSSAVSSTPIQCPFVGDPARMSTITSWIAPRVQRTSLASANRVVLKCMPRNVPARSLRDRLTAGTSSAARGRRTRSRRRSARRTRDRRGGAPARRPWQRRVAVSTKRIGLEASQVARSLTLRGAIYTVRSMNPFACRFCGTTLQDRVVDLGMSPLCESYLPPTARPDGAVLPAARVGLPQVLPGPAQRVRRRRRRSSPSTRTSRRSRRRWLQHAEDYVDDDHRAARARRRQPRRRAGEQRRLPAAVLRRSAASPASGIEPAANVAEAARGRGVPTDVVVLRRGQGRADGRRAASSADLVLGNNVLAQVPDLNDFVAGIAIMLAADGHGHDRVPAPHAAARGEPVRHHLPRALLLLLADRAPRRSSPATA